MPRRLIAIVLAFMLSCFGFTAIGQQLAHASPIPAGQAHAVMAVDAAEPRDQVQVQVQVQADPSPDTDRSGTDHSREGPLQTHAESVLDSADLIGAPRVAAASVVSARVVQGHGSSALPAPFIEGLRRPPRATSIHA